MIMHKKIMNETASLDFNLLKPGAGPAYTRKYDENKNKNIQKYSFRQSQVIIFQIASLLFLLSHCTTQIPHSDRQLSHYCSLHIQYIM